MLTNHHAANPSMESSVFRKRKEASTSCVSGGKVWLQGLLHAGKVEEVLSQVFMT